MGNLTVSQARERIASAAGLCSTDARVFSYLNRAVRRLLQRGKYAGTYQQYRLRVSSSDLITWPRQFATIETAAVNDRPVTIRNEWYEYLQAGPGIQKSTSSLQLVDRGDGHCAFTDITEDATDRKIKVYADVNEGTGKTIILQGYDENGNRIRTQVSGAWIDGERVAIPSTSGTQTLSTKYFTKLVRVIKSETNGVVRLYEYDATNAVNVQLLAIYEPDETVPSYRRSYLPSLSRQRVGGATYATVDVMAKLRFVPVAQENDFLIIGNLDALEEMTRALVHFDNKSFEEGYKSQSHALKLLDEELGSLLGDGPVLMLRVESGDFGAGSVENAI